MRLWDIRVLLARPQATPALQRLRAVATGVVSGLFPPPEAVSQDLKCRGQTAVPRLNLPYLRGRA